MNFSFPSRRSHRGRLSLVVAATAFLSLGFGGHSGTIDVTVCTLDNDNGLPLVGTAVELSDPQQGGSTTGSTEADGCVTLTIAVATAIEDAPHPGAFSMEAAFPNPVENRAAIPFSTDLAQGVVIQLFDVRGRQVGTEVTSSLSAGAHRLDLDLSGMPAGVYLYRIAGDRDAAAGKLVKIGSGQGGEPTLALSSFPGVQAGKTAGSSVRIVASRSGYGEVDIERSVENGATVTLMMDSATSSPPDAPALSSPANGATGLSASSVALAWSASAEATDYDVEVAGDSGFGSIIASANVSGTGHTVAGLAEGTAYFWRVAAANAHGTSGWSSVWSFTTSSGGGGDPGEAPPGGDTETSFPLDRGDDGSSTPGTYKGLWLRVVDNGEPTVTEVNGKIGVIFPGMSNSNQEADHFINTYFPTVSGDVNPNVVFVNCGLGGNALERWNDTPSNWTKCESSVQDAGLSLDQVRVVYHKASTQETIAGTDPKNDPPQPPYPDPGSDYWDYLAEIEAFNGKIKDYFPNVQAVYHVSRSYGGYSVKPPRGEPWSYESGHALNTWLRDNPTFDGMWMGWGSYIWAPSCASGDTNASGVCYDQSDYQGDGVHPADGARSKISQMHHARLMQHAWYRQ